MKTWQLRDFAPENLEQAVRLDEDSSTTAGAPIFPLSEVVTALAARHPAVVAIHEGRLVGSAVSRVDGDREWILRIALHPEWRGQGLGSALLSTLEHRLLSGGVRRLGALLPPDETGSTAFTNSGFVERPCVSFYEKIETITPHAAALLAELGGSVPPAGLWVQLAGMDTEKRLIERRLVLPLARPELADQHGVQPPRAAVLFGSPGTGKTTFARPVASRLGWPFVKLFPSRLGTSDGGLPAAIGGVFLQLRELNRVVVFIDEVEEVAGRREPGTPTAAVVNELLKAIVSFRERPGRLLICATNSVGALDPAFLRHGRFDYVLPIGPPDSPHRWRSAEDRFAITQGARNLAVVGLPPCGTALTTDQVQALVNVIGTRRAVAVALDPDPAGRQATLRTRELLRARGICSLLHVPLQHGHDPELVRRGSGEWLRQAITHHRPLALAPPISA